jgi:hypothetical protein
VQVFDGIVTILPVTASTLSVALVLLVLVSDHGLRSGLTLVGGWFVGAWAVLVLAMLGLLSFVPDTSGGLSPAVQLLVGLVAIGIGAYVLVRLRTRPDAAGREQARVARLADHLTPVRSGALGFALVGLSPRQWVFLVPAAALFTASSVPAPVLSLPLVGAAVASLGVAAPIALVLVVGRRQADALPRARAWWLRHGDQVGAVVALGVGVLFLVAAATGR